MSATDKRDIVDLIVLKVGGVDSTPVADNLLVHKAGLETITGYKEFKATVDGDHGITVKNESGGTSAQVAVRILNDLLNQLTLLKMGSNYPAGTGAFQPNRGVVYDDSDAGTSIVSTGDGDFEIFIGGVNAGNKVFRLKANGKMAVGVNFDPASQLDVVSTEASAFAVQILNNAVGAGHGLYVNTGASSTGTPARVDINGVEKFAVNPDGEAVFQSLCKIALGGIKIVSLATGSLPSAVTYSGYLFYDSTLAKFVRSDGAVWVAMPTVDSLLVHKDGTETIIGVKDFKKTVDADYNVTVANESTGTSSQASIRVKNDASNQLSLIKMGANTATGTGAFQPNRGVLYDDSDAGTSIVSTGDGDFELFLGGINSGNRVMIVKNNGKVGLGTDTPSAKVDIVSTEASAFALQVANNASGAGSGLYVNTGASATGTSFRADVNGVVALEARNDGTVKVSSGFTVAGLPSGVVGARAYVTNALTPTFGATVVGGGAVTIPVFFDGTNWIVG